jgi:hypothetical protein
VRILVEGDNNKAKTPSIPTFPLARQMLVCKIVVETYSGKTLEIECNTPLETLRVKYLILQNKGNIQLGFADQPLEGVVRSYDIASDDIASVKYIYYNAT